MIIMKTKTSYWIQYGKDVSTKEKELYERKSEFVKTKLKLLKRVEELLKDKDVDEFNISKMCSII